MSSSKGLTQAEIARILSRPGIPVGNVHFGGFGLVAAANQMAAVGPDDQDLRSFSRIEDRLLVRAFEETRCGYSVDRVLADPSLASELFSRAQKLGLQAQPYHLNLRLLALRKRSGGSPFKPTAKRDNRPGLRIRFGAAVESALMKISIRYGASVDDLLAFPEVGERFEKIAESLIPGGSPVEYRLCALGVRKARHVEKAERGLFDNLSFQAISRRGSTLSLAKARTYAQEKSGPGLVLLKSSNRPFFLSSYPDSAQGIRQLSDDRLISNWIEMAESESIDMDDLKLRVFTEKSLDGTSLRVWEKRLIQDLQPVFNYPLIAA